MNVMEYIRRRYDVPVKRGGKIRYNGQTATVMQAKDGNFLKIRTDAGKILIVHPEWDGIEYLTEN